MSELNGGVYDEETLTITWDFTYSNINTYENDTYKIDITKEIIIVYKDLDPTIDEVTNEVTAKVKTEISEQDNEDEFTTEIDIKGTVKVLYIDDFGNELIAPITMIEKVGTEYVTEEKEFDGYELLLIEGEKTGIYTEKEQIITYIYTKLGTGGDVEVLPPQTGLDTEKYLPINFISIIISALLIIIKNII